MFDSIIVLGATATGKTDFAIKLAHQLNAEIINADSMYIYKDFNIGTAKPTPKEMNGINHHLIDFLDPLQNFSVSNYRQLASIEINKLFDKNIVPIVVGGTGFYIDSLIKPFSYGNTERDEKLRSELEEELKLKGEKYLHDKLAKLDYNSSLKIHQNDTMRVIRAIEICLSSKTKKSEISNLDNVILKNPLIIGLTMPRELLYERINKRVELMIENGLVSEVENLKSKGYNLDNCNAMKGIGYKEVLAYLNDECTLEEAIDKIKQHSRNYAKRQITWFKRNDDITWLNSLDADSLEKAIKIFKEKRGD